jgi:glutaminase
MIIAENIEKIYNKLKNTDGGKNAEYIHELFIENSHLYAISIFLLDQSKGQDQHLGLGQEINVGDFTHEFAIESCSKVFTLALALEKYGVDFLKKKIGNKGTTEKFNSICAADKMQNHTINSFNNGGAMATVSLLYQPNEAKFINKIVANMSDFAAYPLHVNHKIYKSEILHAERNLAIAYLLKSHERFYGDVETCVDVYTKQCSTMVTSRDVALMAATLANQGKNPKSRKQLIKKSNVDYILKHMSVAGLYDETQKWMNTVGYPTKSAVSGILMIVIPGVMGIGIVSPPLNKFGNSVKGIKTALKIAQLLKVAQLLNK